jgi:hypothetical protein
MASSMSTVFSPRTNQLGHEGCKCWPVDVEATCTQRPLAGPNCFCKHGDRVDAGWRQRRCNRPLLLTWPARVERSPDQTVFARRPVACHRFVSSMFCSGAAADGLADATRPPGQSHRGNDCMSPTRGGGRGDTCHPRPFAAHCHTRLWPTSVQWLRPRRRIQAVAGSDGDPQCERGEENAFHVSPQNQPRAGGGYCSLSLLRRRLPRRVTSGSSGNAGMAQLLGGEFCLQRVCRWQQCRECLGLVDGVKTPLEVVEGHTEHGLVLLDLLPEFGGFVLP